MDRLGVAGAALGLAAVALGAFGAHGLEGHLTAQQMDWWDTATSYALPHAVLVGAIAVSGRGGLPRKAGWAIWAGGSVFAATLYAMALGAPRWFGTITPIGGASLLIGWGLLAAHMAKYKR